jgi:hypothetical protein
LAVECDGSGVTWHSKARTPYESACIALAPGIAANVLADCDATELWLDECLDHCSESDVACAWAAARREHPDDPHGQRTWLADCATAVARMFDRDEVWREMLVVAGLCVGDGKTVVRYRDRPMQLQNSVELGDGI